MILGGQMQIRDERSRPYEPRHFAPWMTLVDDGGAEFSTLLPLAINLNGSRSRPYAKHRSASCNKRVYELCLPWDGPK